jgi:hypothetical protein
MGVVMMVLGRQWIAVLAPFFIFFSLDTSQASYQCLQLFKSINIERYYGPIMADYLDKTKGLSPTQIVNRKLHLPMSQLVRAKLQQTKTFYEEILDKNKDVYWVEILPNGEAPLNRVAHQVWQSYQAKMVIALDRPDFGAGVVRFINSETGEYESIYLVGLKQFFKNEVNWREALHRHEMRHLGFPKKVTEGLEKGSAPLAAGGFLAIGGGKGFPEKAVINLKQESQHDDDVIHRELYVTETTYRDYMSLEEIWTHSRDLYVLIDSLERTLSNKNRQQIQNEVDKILESTSVILAILDRTAQLTWTVKPELFFVAGSHKTNSKNKHKVFTIGAAGLPARFFSQVSTFMYNHNILNGFYLLKSPYQQGGYFIFSIPLTQKTDIIDLPSLEMLMAQRADEIGSLATSFRYQMANAYNDLFQKQRLVLGASFESQKNETRLQDLQQSLNSLREKLAYWSDKFR